MCPVLCEASPPSSSVPKESQPWVPKRYGLCLRVTGSAALLCSKIRRRKRETLTWNLRAVMDVTHSTCRKQREGYLHRRNSSCTTSWDGSSPSALSQSPGHPALDQTPGEKMVKDELCSANIAKEFILNTELQQAARKIPVPPLPCQTAEEGAAQLNPCCKQEELVPKGHTCITQTNRVTVPPT